MKDAANRAGRRGTNDGAGRSLREGRQDAILATAAGRAAWAPLPVLTAGLGRRARVCNHTAGGRTLPAGGLPSVGLALAGQDTTRRTDTARDLPGRGATREKNRHIVVACGRVAVATLAQVKSCPTKKTKSHFQT